MDINQLPQILSPFNNLTNITLSYNRIYLRSNNRNSIKVFIWAIYIFYIVFFIISLLLQISISAYFYTALWGPIIIAVLIFSTSKYTVIDLNDNSIYTEYIFLKTESIFKTKEIKRNDILFVCNNVINTIPFIHKQQNDETYKTLILSKQNNNFNYKEIRPIKINSKTNLYHQYGLCFFLKDGKMINIFLENANYSDSIKIASSIADYWQLKQFTCPDNFTILSLIKTVKGIRLQDKQIPYVGKTKKIFLTLKTNFLILLIFIIFWGPLTTTFEFNKYYNSRYYFDQKIRNEGYFKSYILYLNKNKFGIYNILELSKLFAGRKF